MSNIRRTHEKLWDWIREPKHSNAVVAVFTLLLFITTFVYKVFAALQWLTMQATLNEMKASGSIATDQTWRAIDNMNWLARTMDGALKQSQKAMDVSQQQSRDAFNASVEQNRLDQRAWVGVIEAGPAPEIREGAQMDVTVVLLNSGKTPALKTIQSGRWRIAPGVPFDPPRELQAARSQQEGVIQPSGKRNLLTHLEQPLTKYQSDSIAAGYFKVRFFGIVTYLDVFGRGHWTKFCLELDMNQGKATGIRPCDVFNEAN